MSQPAKPQGDFRTEASIREGAAPLESILRTEELRSRPWRAPDYEQENRALMALAGALADSKANIFHVNLFLARKPRFRPASFKGLQLRR